MNYAKVAAMPRKPKKRDEQAALLMMELLCASYNMLELISDLESYGWYRHKFKQRIARVENIILQEKDGYLAKMFDIDIDGTIELMQGRRHTMKQICMMTPEEVQTVNLVLKAVEQNRTNHKRVNNFVKKLIDKTKQKH